MIELRPYQKLMVEAEIANNNLLVVSPMGSGKTLATLTALVALIAREGVKNVLILAPKRVAKSVWAQEASERGLPLNIKFCDTYVDIQLFLHDQKSHHVCVCSVTKMHHIPDKCWDVVVMDESTLFGNKMSKRSKEARRICNGVKRRIELTGTPVHRGYEKLWHQIFLLDGGKSLGKSLTAFRSNYMRVKYQVNGVVTVWEINPSMIQPLHNDIKHLVHVVKDSVKLPPVLYKTIYVNLPERRMREYDEFERTSIIEFREENPALDAEMERRGLYDKTGCALQVCSTKQLIAFAASSRGSKLRQLATGAVYADETNKTYSVTHTEKIDALQELRESYDGGILVAYNFISEYEELKKAFPQAKRLETADDIADWNAGKITMVLAHAQSLGHGLNLQFGGHVIVWYSPTYDAEIYSQFNARLPRPGQAADAVSVLHLVARNTIEERIVKILKSREQVADSFKNL